MPKCTGKNHRTLERTAEHREVLRRTEKYEKVLESTVKLQRSNMVERIIIYLEGLDRPRSFVVCEEVMKKLQSYKNLEVIILIDDL